MSSTGVAVVLPARYHSTRFPGKPLARVAGKTLVEWVYRRASGIRGISRVLVATDHDEIAQAVRDFGGEVVMTARDHATGTDRVAEVARSIDEDVVVNLQADEPVFPPTLIEEMIATLQRSGGIDVVTACHPIREDASRCDPNVVKVVMDRSSRALYFSRSPIPSFAHTGSSSAEVARVYRHAGIYVFTRRALLAFAAADPAPLELAEGLEQLRALENGMSIHVVVTDEATIGVDVPGDIKAVEKALGSS